MTLYTCTSCHSCSWKCIALMFKVSTIRLTSLIIKQYHTSKSAAVLNILLTIVLLCWISHNSHADILYNSTIVNRIPLSYNSSINKKRIFRNARINLDIFVFHNNHHVRLGDWQQYKFDPNQSSVMSLCGVVEEGQEIFNHGLRRKIEEHVVVWQLKKNPNARHFVWVVVVGCPRSHYRAHPYFPTFVFGPDAGNFMWMSVIFAPMPKIPKDTTAP